MKIAVCDNLQYTAARDAKLQRFERYIDLTEVQPLPHPTFVSIAFSDSFELCGMELHGPPVPSYGR